MSRKNKQVPTIRSSAAEYLSFIAASDEGGVEAVYADEDVWLSQKMMGTLYDAETHTINYHLKKVFSDSELEENSVIRDFRMAAQDGKNYHAERAVQFRKWATVNHELTVQKEGKRKIRQHILPRFQAGA